VHRTVNLPTVAAGGAHRWSAHSAP